MKSFKSYLIPSVIASLFMSCYAIIDGIFIGQSVGDIGLSAINIAWPITAFLQCIAQAIGLSAGILISILSGRNEDAEATRLKLTAIVLIVIIGIVLGMSLFIFRNEILILFKAEGDVLILAEKYIRVILYGTIFQMLGVGLIPLLKNSGKSGIAMIASITSILTNLCLDYLLIMHFDYGLTGAAAASVIAQAAACAVCIAFYIPELKGIIFKGNHIKHIFVGACAPFILNYSYSFLIILTNAICMSLGGYEAVAAYTLLSYILYILGAVGLGVGDAIQPLFSYYYAKNDRSTSKMLFFKTVTIGFVLCFALNSIVFSIRKPLGHLFNLSDLAFEFYNKGIIYYSLGFLFVPFIKIFSSFLYSIEDKILANILVILEPIILTPIGYWILTYFFKLEGVWITYLICQIILFTIGLLFIFIARNKKTLQKIDNID